MSGVWLNLKRVARSGFISFWRNGLISFSSVLVMTVTLFIIGSLIVATSYLNAALADIESKVDINVYFVPNAPEDQVLTLKSRLDLLPEVAEVEHLNPEQALARFKERNKDNELILQAVDELGENPLGSVFNIKAIEPSQYEGISGFLESQLTNDISGESAAIIDKINYHDNKLVIDKLSNLITGAHQLGFITSIVLVIMALLVAFTTIRLAIYNSREEISVMKLVGASKSYIRGPFIVEGVMYGVFATFTALILLYGAMSWISSATAGFFGGTDLAFYFRDNFGQIFAVLFLSGVILGIVSSFIAIRRYLDR